MIQLFFEKRKNDQLDAYFNLVKKINEAESSFTNLSDKDLCAKTHSFKEVLSKGESLDSILVPAFCTVREASKRVLGLRHFDVQLVGGMILNSGNIAEMQTGEGKTLVCTLATYLNALSGRGGVHIVTVNEYLAERDAKWVGQIHEFLNLSVGLIKQDMSKELRKQNYLCDIVYTTNSELGFDFLRDNLATSFQDIVQRDFNFCIIDEVDSILIDESRTPLIISGEANQSKDKYIKAATLAVQLKLNLDYEVDQKAKNVILTDTGIKKCEYFLNVPDLYLIDNPWAQFILNALKAKELFVKNTQYIVQNQEIIIVDEFTGRVMPGRRWSDGLHQSVEAKEGVPIQKETQTLASITYQNFFLLYPKLAGMTGTAKTEEIEFEKIYGLNVFCVPTNKKSKRVDKNDLVYRTQFSKWKAVAEECKKLNKLGVPILLGTTSVKNSEILSCLLSQSDIEHELLNAKPENIRRESEIVAQAGRFSSVTIATNIAGRGTDIILGGNIDIVTKSFLELYLFPTLSTTQLEIPNILSLDNKLSLLSETISTRKVLSIDEFSDSEKNLYNEAFSLLKTYFSDILERERTKVNRLGGLWVIGTERHESRRIDNQLRGRSGRQGDPGTSVFFLSLEDNLLQVFGGEKIAQLMNNFQLEADVPIESSFLSKSLDSAQKKVENFYFDSRKQLFEYDEVMNTQRKVIFSERRQILDSENLKSWVLNYLEMTVLQLFEFFTLSSNTELVLEDASLFFQLFGLPYGFKKNTELSDQVILSFWSQQVRITYDIKESYIELFEPGLMRQFEKLCFLQQIDFCWQKHLQDMDILKDLIGWRSYGQRDPLMEYRNEGFQTFLAMTNELRQGILYLLFRSELLFLNSKN